MLLLASLMRTVVAIYDDVGVVNADAVIIVVNVYVIYVGSCVCIAVIVAVAVVVGVDTVV